MYAIMECSGRQYKVAEGDILKVELLHEAAGSDITLDKILAVKKDAELIVGKPYVEGAQVKAKVLEHGKGKKIVILKYKPKKDFRKKQGHRQPYTAIEIVSIEA